jgi:hypothetical protein
MGETVATACSCGPHSWVGEVACVTAIGARRVDFKLIGKARFGHLHSHYLVCRRRTTNVPEADKKDAFYLIGYHIITIFNILWFTLRFTFLLSIFYSTLL